MERLNKNIKGYGGETIDIKSILKRIEEKAQEKKWEIEVFYENQGFKFLALKREGKKEGKNIYISAGIHGDEPAGPLAALKLLKEDQWNPDLSIWFCPVLNPLGFTLNKHENEKGIDLNRDYKDPKTSEVRAHVTWLEKQPQFALSICIHEDWEYSGFYILSPRVQDSSARSVINKVKKIFPINTSPTIEGFPADNGVVSPKVNFDERPEWPEALWLVKNKGGEHYTFEAASDYPLVSRVGALVAATREAIDKIGAR